MTTQAIKLELEPREVLGKKVSLLRKAGIIPVHLYGAGVESRPLQCQAQKLIQVLSAAGGSTPISVTITGESGTQLAFAREIQWDPRRDDIIHVDLLVADTSRPSVRSRWISRRSPDSRQTRRLFAATFEFRALLGPDDWRTGLERAARRRRIRRRRY